MKIRNSNFELLRIVSMFLIVLYHVILPLPQAIWMQEYRKAGCHGLRDACSYPLSGGRSDALLPPGFMEFLRQNDAAAVPDGPSPK